MDEHEIAARLAGLRIALAFAIKATCRNPAEIQARVAALQEIAGLIPVSLHPGVKDELDAIISAMARLPVRDPTMQQAANTPHRVENQPLEVEARPIDTLLGELL